MSGMLPQQSQPESNRLASTIQSSSPRFSLSSSSAPTSGAHREIAIAVDLSDESAFAVKWAVQNYLRPGDAVTLLHIRPTGADWGSSVASIVTDEESQQKLKDDVDAFTTIKVTDLAHPLVDSQIPFKIHIVKDHDMKERLCLEVERLGLSAVIMGSRGFGASKRNRKDRLGSVSDYCVRHCICPVVIVRYPDEKDGGATGAEAVSTEAAKLAIEKKTELHPVLEEDQEYHDVDDEPKENSNIGLPSEDPDESERATRRSQRSKNYSEKEDLLLVSGWLITSKNTITGNDQHNISFWKRIYDYFVKNGGNVYGRSQHSLMQRWSKINKKCGKFAGWVFQIEERQQIGQTEHDRLAEAKEVYASIMGEKFDFEHCWEILKNEQKWTDTVSNKRPKNRNDASPALSHPSTPLSHPSTPESTNLDDGEASTNLLRPSDKNASKQELKKKKRKSIGQEMTSTLISNQHRQDKLEMERIRGERHEKALAQREKQLAQQERQLSLEAERIQLDKSAYEDKIMQTDTTGMDTLSAQYYNGLKKEIIAKRSFK